MECRINLADEIRTLRNYISQYQTSGPAISSFIKRLDDGEHDLDAIRESRSSSSESIPTVVGLHMFRCMIAVGRLRGALKLNGKQLNGALLSGEKSLRELAEETLGAMFSMRCSEDEFQELFGSAEELSRLYREALVARQNARKLASGGDATQ